MKEVKILVFGSLVDVLGSNNIMIPLENKVIQDEDDSNGPNLQTCTDDVLSVLKMKFPLLSEMKFVIALDKKIVQENTVVDTNSEIAILPPYSGG